MVALNQMASPAVARAMISFKPVLGGAAEPHEPFLGGGGGLLFGADRVGFDDGGLQQGLQPTPRHRT